MRASGRSAVVLGLVAIVSITVVLLADDAPSEGDSAPAPVAREVVPATTPDVAEGPRQDPSPTRIDAAASVTEPATDGTHENQATVEDVEPVVRGIVVDVSGKAIGGAAVRFIPSGGTLEELGVDATRAGLRALLGDAVRSDEILPTTRTGADGRFAVDGRWTPGPAGDAWPQVPEAVVDAPGYAVRAVPLRGYAGGAHDAGTIHLEIEAVVEGRVVDTLGVPLADVAIAPRWYHPEPRVVAEPGRFYEGSIEAFLGVTSDHLGRFRIEGFWTGRLALAFSLVGHAAVHTDPLACRGGETIELGDVVLRRGGTIVGWVRDDEGRPIDSAVLWLAPTDLRELFVMSDVGPDVVPLEIQMARDDRDVLTARSREDGGFVIDGVNGDDVALYVEADGFEPTKVSNVKIGGDPVLVSMSRPAKMTIRVVEAGSGASVADARVEVRRITGWDDFLDAPMMLDVEPGPRPGVFLARGAGPLEQRIEASATGRATRWVRAEGVAAGGESTVTVELDLDAVATGRVIDDRGTPIADAEVRLRPALAEQGPVLRATTAAQGLFRVTNLAAGSFEIDVRAHGYVDSSPRTVTVAVGRESALGDVVVHPAARLSGRLTTTLGEPTAGVEVRLRGPPPQRTSRESATDVSGRFVFDDLAAGDYVLSAEPGAMLSLSLAVGDQREVELTLRRPPIIEGRVTAAGAPMDGVTIIAFHEEERTLHGSLLKRRRAETDSDGGYRLDLDTAGAFRLLVNAPGGLRMESHVVLAWDDRLVHDLVLGTGSLSGRVIDRTLGKPLVGRIVATAATHEERGVTETDAEGRFALQWLSAGNWMVSAHTDDHLTLEAGPFAVRLGEVTSIPDLALEVGGRLAGLVTTQDGVLAPDGYEVLLASPADADDVVASTEIERGRYELTGLPAGTLRLFVTRPAVKDLGDPETDNAFDLLVTIESGRAHALDIVLSEAR